MYLMGAEACANFLVLEAALDAIVLCDDFNESFLMSYKVVQVRKGIVVGTFLIDLGIDCSACL